MTVVVESLYLKENLHRLKALRTKEKVRQIAHKKRHWGSLIRYFHVPDVIAKKPSFATITITTWTSRVISAKTVKDTGPTEEPWETCRSVPVVARPRALLPLCITIMLWSPKLSLELKQVLLIKQVVIVAFSHLVRILQYSVFHVCLRRLSTVLAFQHPSIHHQHIAHRLFQRPPYRQLPSTNALQILKAQVQLQLGQLWENIQGTKRESPQQRVIYQKEELLPIQKLWGLMMIVRRLQKALCRRHFGLKPRTPVQEVSSMASNPKPVMTEITD